jgi:hypothetical protein
MKQVGSLALLPASAVVLLDLFFNPEDEEDNTTLSSMTINCHTGRSCVIFLILLV